MVWLVNAGETPSTTDRVSYHRIHIVKALPGCPDLLRASGSLAGTEVCASHAGQFRPP